MEMAIEQEEQRRNPEERHPYPREIKQETRRQQRGDHSQNMTAGYHGVLLAEVEGFCTECAQKCPPRLMLSGGFPHNWQESMSASGVGRLCLRWGLNLSPQLPKPEL